MRSLLLALFLAVLPAAASPAALTYSDPGCTSFTLAGSPPNQTLVCNTAPVVTPPSNGGTTPPPPPPPVVGTPGLERFDAAPSDWARWQFWNASEFVPLQQRLMSVRGWTADQAYVRINQQINAYQSTLHVYGTRGVNNTYSCFIQPGNVLTPDVGGVCDRYIATRFPAVLYLGPLR